MEAAPNVRIIPASKQTIGSTNIAKKLNVAAYCRVSTDQEEQQNSYQVQIEYYTSYINANPEWNFAGIFADEGISGTQTKNRNEFNRMIRLCKKKKIDLTILAFPISEKPLILISHLSLFESHLITKRYIFTY